MHDTGPRGLKRRLATARAALIWEAAWPALWPAAGVTGLFLIFAWLDLLPVLPGWLHGLILLGFCGALGWTLWRGIKGLRLPAGPAARRRLERQSGLAHRPLDALDDRLAVGAGNEAAEALWRLHRARMRQSTHGLRAGWPSPGLARRDPVALRGGLVVLLTIALVVAWPEPGPRLARALVPAIGTPAAPPTLDLWITPPAYTGRAPLFPQRAAIAGAALEIPAGSTVRAQLHGGRGTPHLVIDDTSTPFQELGGGTYAVQATIDDGSRLMVRQRDTEIAGWPITLIANGAPRIAWSDVPAPTERTMLRLSYEAADDYGLAKITAVIRRAGPDGKPLDGEQIQLDLALPGLSPRTAKQTSFHDLTAHPWAGLRGLIGLTAVDGAGLTGQSRILDIQIPERVFTHPVARRVIAERKRLTEMPGERIQIARALLSIAARPDLYGHDIVTFLALASARARLVHQRQDADVRPVQDLLWDAALRIEDGPLSLAERELRQAQDALMQALARDATDEELERLMRELQNALDRFLQSLAERMQSLTPEQLAQLPFDPRAQMLQSTDLQKMLDQARDLMRSGARDAARQMLSALREMLENLRTAGIGQMSPQDQQAGEAMRQLQDLINRQNQLLDRTFRQWRQGQGQPQGAPRQGGQGQQGAMDQRQLRQALQALRDMLRQMGQQGEGRLGQAGQAMGEAVDALERGAPGQAVGPQTQALENLRQAGRDLMQQMMQGQAGNGVFGPAPMPFRQGLRRDPLGRPVPGSQGLSNDDVQIPDAGDIERARRIMDELRRRAGETHRPKLELDYIDRLLRRF